MLVMMCRMVLTEIISQIIFALLPIDKKVTLVATILHPMESHIHCLRAFRADGRVNNTSRSGIVSLDWGGWLWMFHFD